MKIVTSLSFQGRCREAFEFYANVLGGRITAAIPYADAPPDMPVSVEGPMISPLPGQARAESALAAARRVLA